MAIPTNAFTTYTAVGQREDLSNIIYDISPTETPFSSRLARVKAKGILHDWQMDVLGAADAAGAIEGDDHSGVAITPTLKLRNYCAIFRKDIVVTGSEQAVDKAGRADELDYQTMQKGKELKRNIEKAITGVTFGTAGGTTTARALSGAEAWLPSVTIQGITPAYATEQSGATAATTAGVSTATGLLTAAPTDATVAGALTSANFKQVVREAWTNGGEPKDVFVGPFNKQAMSAFTGIATLQRDAGGLGQATIVGAADVYRSDFGVHTIHPNRFSRDETCLVMDMSMWGNAELRPMQTVAIAKTGDSDKMMLLTELTLECRNWGASGKVADLTTA